MFDKAFERLIGHEGNFQDDPADRGNWTSGKVGVGQCKGTKFGIAAMSYPHIDIRNLTVEQAKTIYRKDYWQRAQADEYDAAIGFQLFDAAVNHGIGNAVRMLQRAVKVVDDGDIGPVTLATIKRTPVNDVLLRFLGQRLQFMTQVSTWERYGKGWARRIAGNLALAAEDN